MLTEMLLSFLCNSSMRKRISVRQTSATPTTEIPDHCTRGGEFSSWLGRQALAHTTLSVSDMFCRVRVQRGGEYPIDLEERDGDGRGLGMARAEVRSLTDG